MTTWSIGRPNSRTSISATFSTRRHAVRRFSQRSGDVDARIAEFATEAAVAGLRAADIRAGSAALVAERQELEAQLDAVQPDYTWAELGAQVETRAWLEAVIDRVVIAPAKRPQFDPARATITWR